MVDTKAFATQLAVSIAPDEIDVAPEMIDAYLQGGKAQKELFQSAGNIPGAFSSTDIVILTPYLLQAIARAGSLIVNLLTSDVVGDSISIVKTALELISTGHKAHEFFSTPKDHLTSKINVITDTMSIQVQGTGMTKDQCDAIALRLMKMLLENSTETKVLVGVLVEAKK